MLHRPIQQLSTALVNRIAAGEVIERPASVVKELVENSLDAGATRIIVEVEDGGRELVRVIDDGGGIPTEELSLAFTEHATSKISCDDDLFRISTMGFRGEALASIGSVSHARLVSRVAASDAAYEVTDRGGELGPARAAAGNVGTTVEIRNLFYNTPARRKFLKGTGTEFGHISEMVLRLALPYPHVAFKLTHNGRVTLDLTSTTPEQRLLEAWPKEFHEQRLPIDVRDGDVRLSGIIGLPELARPTGKYQYLYLNGRYIRDRFLVHAAREAYRGLTEPGRHPAAVLLLEIPPEEVDVNVHPSKIEVRFRDSGRMHGLMLSALREKLLGSELSPSAVPLRADGREAGREDMRERLAAFFRGTPETVEPPSSSSLDYLAGPPAGRDSEHQAPVDWSGFGVAKPQAVSEAAHATGGSSLNVPAPAPAIQLHNSYLVAQTDDGMIIIDQHALHERVMYEELRIRLGRGPLESQRLLIPQTVAASARQVALLDQIAPLLQRLGIEVVPFGPDAVAVQAFPSFLWRLEPGEFVRELLERGEQELLDLHEEELLHELMDMMACKAAVKAGDPLSPAEIDALLARRELIDRSSNCPHGRPTTLKLSLGDLEKQFKRTGF